MDPTQFARQFSPEVVNTKEAGIEIGLLKNRINIEASYYHQKNTDQIVNVNISNTTGFTNLIRNAAAFTNKGLELDLKLNPLVRIKDVDINVRANYTHQTSKISSIFPGINEIGIGSNNYIITGQSAYVFKLTDYVRDDQGRVIVDANTGMPTIDPNLKMFGKTTPDNIVGITLNIVWKNLSLTAVGDYRTGNQFLADQLGTFLDDNGISARSAANGRRAFVFPNSVYDDGTGKYVVNTDVYTQNYGRLFYNTDLNTGVQTNYLTDGSFWKLRELSLGYSFPASIFANSRSIKGVTIGITARNLITWLPKSNVYTDPEFSAGTGNAQGSSTAAQLPPTRIFGANVVFQF
ncbi:MAG: TonB-dependent receptor [Chryseobacterium sp.]|nr:MAG: TonB-dependent receptor [Chryseobacterium sp.]